MKNVPLRTVTVVKGLLEASGWLGLLGFSGGAIYYGLIIAGAA